MPITVYDKPGCVQCRATEKWLTRKGIPYTAVDVTANDDDYRACLALGYQQLPVVVVSTGVPVTLASSPIFILLALQAGTTIVPAF